MVIRNKSFANADPDSLPNEAEFENCNFARSQPDTSGPEVKGVRLWPSSDEARIFRNCNMLNCEPPPNSTVIGGNTWIVETKVPGRTESLVIDGEVVETTQYYDSIIHARYVNGQYLRDGFPQVVEEE